MTAQEEANEMLAEDQRRRSLPLESGVSNYRGWTYKVSDYGPTVDGPDVFHEAEHTSGRSHMLQWSRFRGHSYAEFCEAIDELEKNS